MQQGAERWRPDSLSLTKSREMEAWSGRFAIEDVPHRTFRALHSVHSQLLLISFFLELMKYFVNSIDVAFAEAGIVLARPIQDQLEVLDLEQPGMPLISQRDELPHF